MPGRRSKAASATGLALLVLGAALPSSALLLALGVTSDAGARQLWVGAALFRGGLALLGLHLAVAGRLQIWGTGSVASNPPSRGEGWAVAGLAVILAVALGLRLVRLGEGIWYDEIVAYVGYLGLSYGEILTTYLSENQHFLYTLLARAAFDLFGEGVASLRLPAALLGVASIAALYPLARRVASVDEALLSCGLLCVSYHHVWFSQNARGYTGLLFLTLLSSWLLLRALEEGRARLWISYAVSVALGVFTHVTMVFVFVAQAGLYAAWLAKLRSRGVAAWSGALLGLGLAGLLSFQLYALALPQFLSLIGMTAGVPEWTNPLWTLYELALGMNAGFAGGVVALVALAVFGTGLASFARTAPAIVVLFAVPGGLGAATMMATRHPLWPRFFFFLLGFAVLIAVRGATLAGGWAARTLRLPQALSARAGTAVVAVLILASVTRLPVAWLPKQDFLGARRFLEAQREPTDAVVTVGLATLPYSRLYRTGWDSAESADALNAIRARARRTWVVYTIPLQLQGEHPELMDAVRKEFTEIRRFGGTLGGGTIFVCRAEGSTSAGAS